MEKNEMDSITFKAKDGSEYVLGGEQLTRYIKWAYRMGFPAIPPDRGYMFHEYWPTWRLMEEA